MLDNCLSLHSFRIWAWGFFFSLFYSITSFIFGIAVHAGNVSAVVNRVYDYYQQRYLQKAKLYGAGLLPVVGSSVLIDTLQSKQIGGIVERMVIDLSGGFTAQAEVLGVVAV